ALLGRAFFDDPLERYMLPDDGERLKASTARFRNVLRYGHLFGEVHAAEGLDAVALWLPPGETEMTDDRMAQAGMFELRAIVGEDAFRRFIGVVEMFDELHASDAPDPHWYLLVIGVDPPQQRRGLGSALIEPMLARADEQGLPCYLETANEGNIGFYEHLGFAIVHDIVEGESGLRLLTFRREPRET
ncbi:MAG: GNAT family N-acetyltransferase, partial [Chloroflexota bacterium]|nr:GNAT family N-acetyltransferase [Chloroflexota bacterium]